MDYRRIITVGLSVIMGVMTFIPLVFADQKPLPKKHILFIMTSNNELLGTGKKTGVWLNTLTEPYYLLKDAGYEVTLASINGLKPPVDPRSEQEHTPTNTRFLTDNKAMATFEDTVPLASLKADGYDAVYFPGGHGLMWDFLDNSALSLLVGQFNKDNKIIAAVDHGPAALMGVSGTDGKPLVEGRKITAFTKEEEKLLQLDSMVPVYADFSLEICGATMVRGTPFKPNAIQDGNIITGQNPASVDEVAHLLLVALKRQGN